MTINKDGKYPGLFHWRNLSLNNPPHDEYRISDSVPKPPGRSRLTSGTRTGAAQGATQTAPSSWQADTLPELTVCFERKCEAAGKWNSKTRNPTPLSLMVLRNSNRLEAGIKEVGKRRNGWIHLYLCPTEVWVGQKRLSCRCGPAWKVEKLSVQFLKRGNEEIEERKPVGYAISYFRSGLMSFVLIYFI